MWQYFCGTCRVSYLRQLEELTTFREYFVLFNFRCERSTWAMPPLVCARKAYGGGPVGLYCVMVMRHARFRI